MKLSIVIPVYNVDRFLYKGLESIVNQSYKNIDIVCVDDGSTDNSLKVLNEFAQRDNRVRIVTQENKGTYIARQVGVEVAKGDYILFFDPDDRLELNACEELASFIEKNDDDIIQYGININCDDNNNPIAEWLDAYQNTDIDYLYGSETMWQTCYVDRKIPWNLIGKVIKASVAKQAFKNQGRSIFSTLTDYFATYYVFAYAKSYRCFAKRLYNYNFGVGVSTKSNTTLEDFKRSIKNIKELCNVDWFADKHASLIGTTGYSVAKEIMPEYCINNALNFAHSRLPADTQVTEWFIPLVEEMKKSYLKSSLKDLYRNNRMVKILCICGGLSFLFCLILGVILIKMNI